VPWFGASCYNAFMKYVKKLPIRILIALIAGFLLAGAFTKITYSCAPSAVPAGESASQCVAFEKAVMHPSDLFSNKQDSLTKFSAIFAVTSMVTFAILSVIKFIRPSFSD
jgi:hypothetical protein